MLNSGFFQVAQAGWSLDNLLQKGQTQVTTWAGGIVAILGLIALGFAAYKFFKAVTSQQGAGKFAMDGGIALVVGGFLFFGGFTLLKDVGQGGKDTITTLGQVAHLVGQSADVLVQNIHLFF